MVIGVNCILANVPTVVSINSFVEKLSKCLSVCDPENDLGVIFSSRAELEQWAENVRACKGHKAQPVHENIEELLLLYLLQTLWTMPRRGYLYHLLLLTALGAYVYNVVQESVELNKVADTKRKNLRQRQLMEERVSHLFVVSVPVLQRWICATASIGIDDLCDHLHLVFTV